MRIRWDEIPAGGLSLSLADASWVPVDVVRQGPGECAISLRKDGGLVLLSGTLRLPVVLECDRCLDSFVHVLTEELELVFSSLAKESEAEVASEYLCKDGEPDVVYLAEPVVDLSSVLAQQVYLALPEKRLCRDNCLGLCPECGVNLGRTPCNCAKGTGASPFNVLAKLKVQ